MGRADGRERRPRDGKGIPQLLEDVDELVVELLLRVAAPAVVQEAEQERRGVFEVAARGSRQRLRRARPGEAFFSQEFR